jgi:hypothetical protein
MKPKDRRIPRSISFSPEMAALTEALQDAPNQRSAVVVEAIETVLRRRTLPFRPNRANVLTMERGAARIRAEGKHGMEGKEMWVQPGSVSFPPDVFDAVNEHRARLGMGRTRYVICCIEHVHGIRPHPELFEPSMRI